MLSDITNPIIGRCSICLDDSVEVVNPCPDKTHSSACKDCLRSYIQSIIDGAAVGTCPILSCPICLSKPPTERNKKRAAQLLLSAELFHAISLSDTQREKYNEMVNSLCTLQCSGCHTRKSLLLTGDSAKGAEFISANLTDSLKRTELRNTIFQFNRGEISIQECYNLITLEYFPSLLMNTNGEEIINAVLMCVSEPERRANLQLRYYRDRPFITTSCCKKKHCFRCKTKEWHHGKSCEENSGATMDGRVLPCPQCEIQLTKGDGCDSITCVCKFNFSWTAAVRTHEQVSAFARDFPENTANACAEVLFERVPGSSKQEASAWRNRHKILANEALLACLQADYKQNTNQWCSTYRSEVHSGPAILKELQTLWRTMHPTEVMDCDVQNHLAMKSLFLTMYPKLEDKVLKINFMKAFGFNHGINEATLSNRDNIVLSESATDWLSTPCHKKAVDACLEERKLHLSDQFLQIYGHLSPKFDSETVAFNPVVLQFDPFKSDDRLIFTQASSIVTRIGSASCYPAAIAPATTSLIKARFRILSCEKRGNLLSFGLGTRKFPRKSSNGFGVSNGSWGVKEHRDPSLKDEVLEVYECGKKVASWRSLVAGDSITLNADLNRGTLLIKLNDEFTHQFNSIPVDPSESYCIGTTLATDAVVRLEQINALPGGGEDVHFHNKEHVLMFQSFRNLHVCKNGYSRSAMERIRQKAARWAEIVENPEETFNTIFPAIQVALGIHEKRQQITKLVTSWNDEGNRLTWNIIDLALSWGILNGREDFGFHFAAKHKVGPLVSSVAKAFEESGALNSKVISG